MKTMITFELWGRTLVSRMAVPGAQEHIAHFPKLKLGFAAGWSLDSDRLSLVDSTGRRWLFAFHAGTGNVFGKWCSQPLDLSEELSQRFTSVLGALTNAGVAFDAYYNGTDLEGDKGQNGVLLALTDRGLAVFRESTKPHTFFQREYAFFCVDRYSFEKRTGAAVGIGLALGKAISGARGIGGFRITDKADHEYCIIASNRVIAAILDRVKYWQHCEAERNAGDGAPAALAERVGKLLQSQVSLNGLFAAPDIPPKKLANAARACSIPANEPIFGLIDCTLMGSAKHCVLFGPNGIYYRNARSLMKPGAGAIPYTQFAARLFYKSGSHRIDLDHGEVLDTHTCTIPDDKLVDILQQIRHWVIQLRV